MPKARTLSRSKKAVTNASTSTKTRGRKPSSNGSKKPAVKLRGHVIPNSHLDREWTLEFQQTRRLTVEFLDAVLDIFDKVPEYTFLLDSQTIPLEDYLEIRPENEERIREAVQSGRLTIGPWYTAPDSNTISGESLLRNLLVGHRTAEKYGPVMKVGYTPFGFGQVSQLPQIYSGFDIDVVLFYRGITSHESPQSEFFWTSPDGTKAFCSRFGTKARYNFFVDVWRRVVYGREFGERIFPWRDGGMPFKRINEERDLDHYFLLRPKKEIHPELMEPGFRGLLADETKHFSTPIIPLMQGMDTTKPDPMEADVVREIQDILEEGEEVFFSTMPQYIEDLRNHVDYKKLKNFKGEMRNAGPPSPYTTQLGDTASSRPRQKVAHSRAERLLQRMAEPFAALATLTLGEQYPRTYLDKAWRYLLQVHPHDTICGTGVDKLETDSLYRLDQVKTISDIVLDDALATLQVRVDNSKVAEDEVVLTVFNPSPRRRTETMDVFLDVPLELEMPEFEIVDTDGNVVDWSFVYRKPGEKTVRDNTDLTTALLSWDCKIQLRAEDVPGMGYRTYIARRCKPVGRKERMASSPHEMENENLVVLVQPDGTLTLIDKQTGTVFENLHYLTDNGEGGDNWDSRPTSIDRVISSRGLPATISLEENSSLSATIRVAYHLRVPSGIVTNDSHHFTQRAEREEDLLVESYFTLKAGARRVDVKTTIHNRAKNHRLRVHFPTDLVQATHSAAETPFDVIEREIVRSPENSFSQTTNPRHPCLRFADVSDGNAGLALLTKGIHEYEATEDDARAVVLTLLRAYEVTLCTVSYRWERRPDQPMTHVLGEHTVEYAIYPHAGNWEAGEVVRETEDFHLPLIPCQTTRGEGDAPQAASMLEISPSSLVLSAAKQCDFDPDETVIRLYNPGTKKAAGKLSFPKAVKAVRALNSNEEPLSKSAAPKLSKRGKSVSVDVGAKKIVTLGVKLS